MKGRLLLDIVIRESTAIFQLFPSEDQTLLIWRNALLVLDFALDVIDGVGRFNLKGDGLSGNWRIISSNCHQPAKAKATYES